MGDYHLLSPGHAEYGLLRWGHLQCLPSKQWSKAGLCPCSNPVRDFLLDASPVCLCRLYRRCLCADEVRQASLQHRQTPHQNQSLRELLFADDAALTSHSEEGLQCLLDKLSHACKEFGLTISLRKTNILAQDAESPLSHHHGQHGAGGCGHLHLLGLYRVKLDAEISFRIAKAAAVVAKLNKGVWGNDLLSKRTKMCDYQACILSTLL